MEVQMAFQQLHLLEPAKQELVLRLIEALCDSAPPPPEFDLNLVLPQWVNFLISQHKAASTIRYYTSSAKSFLDSFPQPSSAHLDAFLALLPLTTTHKYVSALRHLFAFCAMRGLYTNIASHLKNPYHFKTRQAAPQETVAKLLGLPLKPRDSCILALFVETGARLGELRHIELANIHDTYITTIGKGSKARVLYLTTFAKQAVARQLETLPPGEKYLLPTRTGKPIGSREIQRLLERLCQKAGVTKCTPHQLRHYFATFLLQSGASLKAVSTLLGHASVSTTANVYWHLSNSDAYDQAQKYSPGAAVHAPKQPGDPTITTSSLEDVKAPT